MSEKCLPKLEFNEKIGVNNLQVPAILGILASFFFSLPIWFMPVWVIIYRGAPSDAAQDWAQSCHLSPARHRMPLWDKRYFLPSFLLLSKLPPTKILTSQSLCTADSVCAAFITWAALGEEVLYQRWTTSLRSISSGCMSLLLLLSSLPPWATAGREADSPSKPQ